MTVIYYVLYFTYQNELGNHYFQIGYFSSTLMAEKAIDLLRDKPGFVNYRNGFSYEEIFVDFSMDGKENDYKILYELSYEEYDGEMDCFEIIGVYSTFSRADEKKRKILHSKNDIYMSDGFNISQIKVNNIGWTEGFEAW